MGIQELLENPNVDDPAQEEAWNSLKSKPTDYRRRVRHQVRNPSPHGALWQTAPYRMQDIANSTCSVASPTVSCHSMVQEVL